MPLLAQRHQYVDGLVAALEGDVEPAGLGGRAPVSSPISRSRCRPQRPGDPGSPDRAAARVDRPTDDLELVGRALGDLAPRSMTAIRSASWSASSRYCVVSSTVQPPTTSSRMVSHIWPRVRGSSPVVGSSRKISGGRVIRLAARSSRRRMPPENCRDGLGRPPRRGSNCSSRRGGRCADSGLLDALETGEQHRGSRWR